MLPAPQRLKLIRIAAVALCILIVPIAVAAQANRTGSCVPALWYDSSPVPGGALFRFDGQASEPVYVFGTAEQPASKPHVSPDGRRIAFVRYLPAAETQSQIWIANLDGGNARLLTPGMDSDQPSWSPDGARLAFSSIADGIRSIYVIDASGENLGRITGSDTIDDYPVWSPDGELIAYGSVQAAGGNFDLFTIRPDGSDIRQLTFHPAADFRPAWSPDGSLLAFSSTRGDPSFEVTVKWDIFVMRSDGAGVRRITFHEAFALRPTWSPLGNEIAYQVGGLAEDESDWEIYKISSDGGEPLRLTNNEVSDSHPDWNTYSHECDQVAR